MLPRGVEEAVDDDAVLLAQFVDVGVAEEYEQTDQSDRRQIGKVAVLSLGFGGSIGAFSAMGRVYKVYMPESDARRIVDAWRRANAWAVRYWAKLEDYLLISSA